MFEWHSSHQHAFDKIKNIIGTEVLLCYPDFNNPNLFHLYTDASDCQLGKVIMQDKSPIAIYLRNLNTAQKQYTTTERKLELLSPIEIFKEYKNIQLGYHLPIIVITDYKNIFNELKASDCALRWLLLIEVYGLTFEYLPERENVTTVADALSSLDIDSLKIQKEEALTFLSRSEKNSINNIKLIIPMHTDLIFKEQAKVKDIGL
jgi:hypothetical protein